MKLSDFDFELPSKLIAQEPSYFRDESRLLVLHKKTGQVEHKNFSDIVDYFDDGDTFVLNNTKVFPALLYGKKEEVGSKIEVTLLRKLQSDNNLWDVVVDPARKIRVGNKLYFGEDNSLVGEIVDNTTSRGRTIRFIFEGDDNDFFQLINQIGQVPLPGYIEREATEEDKERYQTVYAKNIGAVTAPTAGFHLSWNVLKKLELKGINISELNLTIGIGALREIVVEDLSKHKMETEPFAIPEETASNINTSISEKKKVCAVGVSTMRALESAVSANYSCKPISGWTNKFIYTPYQFSIANAMLSNFHAPKSPMFMATSAFAGHDNVMKAYEEAIKDKYRFLSYGDAILVI